MKKEIKKEKRNKKKNKVQNEIKKQANNEKKIKDEKNVKEVKEVKEVKVTKSNTKISEENVINKGNLNIIKKIGIILVSLITVIGINIDLNANLNFFESIQCNDIKYVIYFICICYFVKDIKFNDKRLNISLIILSFILSIFHIIGYTISNYGNLSGIYLNGHDIIKNILSFIGYFNMIYSIMYKLFNIKFIKKKSDNIFYRLEEKVKKISDKKLFFIITGILVICYLPYLINFYPGILSFDSLFQIEQGLGLRPLTTHHPLIHTVIVTICEKIGYFLTGRYEFGAGLFSLIQIIFMSGVFSFTLLYMKRKSVNIYVLIIAMLYYMFYPVFGMYSITMWKDVPFALAFNLFIICICELVYNKENLFKYKSRIIFFMVSILLMILFRNNGLYVYILTIPFLIYLSRKYIKKILVVIIVPLVIYFVINGPVLKLFNIEKGSIKEALSVPLQQIARVVKYHESSLSNEENSAIHRFISCNDIGGYYDPRLSDPIKGKLNTKYFSSHKGEFIKLWLELFVKYPKDYIESFMCNTEGYWYPETVHTVISKNIYNFENGIVIQKSPLVKLEFIEKYTNFIEARNIPVLGMTFSIGFAVWETITLFVYCIYKKEKRKLIIFYPLFILWLTVLASPVFAEYRYIFGLFTILPVIIALSLQDKFEEEKNEK